jgi:hypothetical protein
VVEEALREGVVRGWRDAVGGEVRFEVPRAEGWGMEEVMRVLQGLKSGRTVEVSGGN